MKNTLLFLSLTSIIFFSSCKKDPVKTEWEQYCEEAVLGGDISLNIDGKNWGTGCVQAIYSETITTDFTNKLLWIYAYNYGSTFYIDSDIEVFYALYSETTSSGVTESESIAGFVDGFIVNAQNSGNLEGKTFASDMTSTDKITITELTSNMAEGTLNFKLFNEEDSSEEISVTGSFEAVIEQ